MGELVHMTAPGNDQEVFFSPQHRDVFTQLDPNSDNSFESLVASLLALFICTFIRQRLYMFLDLLLRDGIIHIALAQTEKNTCKITLSSASVVPV